LTRDRAKAALIVVALVVLAVEGYLLYEYYGRHYGDASSGASVSAPGETTGRVAAGSEAEEGPAAPEASSSGAGAEEDGTFVHRATDTNSRGDYTYLDNSRIEGDPDAVVLAEPSGPYGRNIGVWYEPGERKWAIFNQDRSAVPAGSAFGVAVPPTEEGFVHRADLPNIVGNATYIDDPLVNGEPDAEISVTQNWNPGGGNGVYNDHPVGVGYDEDVGRWFVYNDDNARMPEGAAFNIAVPGFTDPAS
jgi:hypothetical protein